MAKALMRKDLTGMKFGHLTAISVDEERSKDGKVYWFCKCDCGNEEIKSVQSTSLTRKNGTKSCGCARNSKEAKRKAYETRTKYPKDIHGIKFGRLTVIKETDMKSERASDSGANLWECKCDCGNTCYYSRYSLITPNGVKSCGCLYNDTRYEIGKKYCSYDLTSFDFGVGHCNNGTYFFFDKEDYDIIKNYCWWYDGRYVCAHSLDNDKYDTKIIRLHRLVMDVANREDVNIDHKNLIRYDCRKCNLRKATYSENAMNKDYSYFETESGKPGVFKLNNGHWQSSIKVNGKNIYLGKYEKLEDAIEARNNAEIKYFGEFKYDPDKYDIIDEDKLGFKGENKVWQML